MDGIKFFYEDIEAVTIDKNRQLIVKFNKTDNTTKIKRHLLRQFSGDHLDGNKK